MMTVCSAGKEATITIGRAEGCLSQKSHGIPRYCAHYSNSTTPRFSGGPAHIRKLPELEVSAGLHVHVHVDSETTRRGSDTDNRQAALVAFHFPVCIMRPA